MAELLSSLLKSRTALQLENIALRHQIGVLQRSAKKRLELHNSDRLLWVGLSQLWNEWRSALVIVKPETVLAGIGTHFDCSGPGKFNTAWLVARRYHWTYAH